MESMFELKPLQHEKLQSIDIKVQCRLLHSVLIHLHHPLSEIHSVSPASLCLDQVRKIIFGYRFNCPHIYVFDGRIGI